MKEGKFTYNNLAIYWDKEGKVLVTTDEDVMPEMLEYVDLFKDYVKALDDEIFVQAVEMFPKAAGVSTHVLAEALDACIETGKICTYITYFKDCVNQLKYANK